MDTLIRRALDQPRFTWPVSNIVKSDIKKTADEWHIPSKAEAVSLPELSHEWPQCPFLSLPSVQKARRKQCRALRTGQASKASSFERNRKNWDQNLSAGSEKDIISVSPGQRLLRRDLYGRSDAGGVSLQSPLLGMEPSLLIL